MLPTDPAGYCPECGPGAYCDEPAPLTPDALAYWPHPAP